MGPCRHIRSKQVLRLMSQPALSFEVGWGRAVVISKNFNKGALRTTTPIVWVWPSYNHAHISKDGNMII